MCATNRNQLYRETGKIHRNVSVEKEIGGDTRMAERLTRRMPPERLAADTGRERRGMDGGHGWGRFESGGGVDFEGEGESGRYPPNVGGNQGRLSKTWVSVFLCLLS